jgi:hypothetical protein
MDKDIHALFAHLRNTPFPSLGRAVGDFVLYESLLAGTVCTFLAGGQIDPEAVPVPDEETEARLNALAMKSTLDRNETDLLKYAQLLNELREAVVQAVTAAKRVT